MNRRACVARFTSWMSKRGRAAALHHLLLDGANHQRHLLELALNTPEWRSESERSLVLISNLGEQLARLVSGSVFKTDCAANQYTVESTALHACSLLHTNRSPCKASSVRTQADSSSKRLTRIEQLERVLQRDDLVLNRLLRLSARASTHIALSLRLSSAAGSQRALPGSSALAGMRRHHGRI